MKTETSDTSLRIRFEAPLPARTVWDALTRPEAVAAWWGDNFVVDARPGGSFRETWSDGQRTIVTSGTVRCFEPPHVLELSWADDDWPAQTRVTITLQERPDGSTAVTLEHAGFEALTGRDGRRLIADHAAGWQFHMEALQAFLAENG